MTWYGWLLLALLPVMYGLGIVGARAFRKPFGPDRRHGDRREGDRRTSDRRAADRRAPDGLAPSEFVRDVADTRTEGSDAEGRHVRESNLRQGDRRHGDRRRGDRRRPRAVWPTVTVIFSALLLSAIGVVTYAESRVGSFFVASQPELVGAGWADCSTPITWSVDTSRMTRAESDAAIGALRRDFAKWQAASGLTFTFVGQAPVVYNDTDFSVTSNMHPSNRHIYVAFLHNSDSSLLDSRTVGFAEPSKVFPQGKVITEGSIVLSIEYVESVAGAKETALYLHEIGHALGLGHGDAKRDVMYYMVDRNNDLSPADIAGIRALTQVCPATAPPAGQAAPMG